MSLKAIAQRMIRKMWGNDIDPTARIHTSASIDRTNPRGIHIAAGVEIAADAIVLAHDLTRGKHCDTRIGARTRIGERAIVMPGVTIGEDCIVAPAAVVTKDMPARSTAIGNPARIEARG